MSSEKVKQLRSSPNRNLVYVTSVLAHAGFFGLIGSYSMLKKDISQ